MSLRHHALAGLLSLCMMQSVLAAETVLSFDALNTAALSHHPDNMVSDVQVERGNDGRLLYKVELRDASGTRRTMVLDATSRTLLWEDERQMHSVATLPVGWKAGELPSFDRLNALALQRYPGGRVGHVSLRRVGDGRLLYEAQLADVKGHRRQLMIDSARGEILTDRQID